jgi:hypothetical protein
MGKKKGKIYLIFVNMTVIHIVFFLNVYLLFYYALPFLKKDIYCNSLIFMILFCRITSINEETY